MVHPKSSQVSSLNTDTKIGQSKSWNGVAIRLVKLCREAALFKLKCLMVVLAEFVGLLDQGRTEHPNSGGVH